MDLAVAQRKAFLTELGSRFTALPGTQLLGTHKVVCGKARPFAICDWVDGSWGNIRAQSGWYKICFPLINHSENPHHGNHIPREWQNILGILDG